MCLVIGPTSAGKTLLLKRLNTCTNRGTFNDVCEAPATIPTVGTNLVNMLTSRKQDLTLRELGGAMGPIWHSYYHDCQSIVYVIDVANRMQVSAACIQLLDVLSHKDTQKTPVLLLFNKVDMASCMRRTELDSMLRLDEIMQQAKQKIAVLEASALNGHGLLEVARWIQEHSKVTSPS